MTDKVKFVVIEPEHFHAALVHKYRNEEVDPRLFLYADSAPKAAAYVELIEQYNRREIEPTNWEITNYYGIDFDKKSFNEDNGNVVVLAGDNNKKIDFIQQAIEHSKDVFADKPLVINADGYDKLKGLFEQASKDDPFVYDIMTERYEVKNQILKALINNKSFSGGMKITDKESSIKISSLHHFIKDVSGKPLIRPAMFYNTLQQGEGLVDVTTHYIDLVQWVLSSEQIIDIRKDVKLVEAFRWKTSLSIADFKKSTNLDAYPASLQSSVDVSQALNVFSNGKLSYKFKGVPVAIAVNWKVESVDGKGDKFNALFHTNNFTIAIKPDEDGKPSLFVQPRDEAAEFESDLVKALEGIVDLPNLSFVKSGSEYKIIVPDALHLNHEDHFSKVLQQFLDYRKERTLPQWEKSFMLAKYYLTTKALSEAKTTENEIN